MIEKKVSIVIVTYNTLPEFSRCYAALRKFYPTVPLIVVDGSNTRDACYKYINCLKDKNLRKIQLTVNVGHGQGLNHGIDKVQTPYFLALDSDCYLTGKVIEPMLELLTVNVYGVGQVVKVNEKGENSEKGIDYLHPHCALVSLEYYRRFTRFVHHGAPLISTMLSLSKQNLVKVRNFPVEEYANHAGRGTRKLMPKEFKGYTWDRSYLKDRNNPSKRTLPVNR